MVAVDLFAADHLDGVLELCRREGWPSLPDDPVRALRVLQAPGVTTVVACDGPLVVGFAELLSDGEIQAYLALLLVAEPYRRQGVARQLVHEALQRAGGLRIDLLSDKGSTGFYRSLPHRAYDGFRLYPAAEGT